VTYHSVRGDNLGANAIMDVRIEKMKLEIQELLRAGETRESLYYVDWGQLQEIGVDFG